MKSNHPAMYSPLGLFIVQTIIWLNGVAPSTLLSNVTGLSQSRFRNSNKYDLHQSSVKQISERIEHSIRETLKSSFADSQIESIISDIPSKVNGYTSLFSDFIYLHFIKEPDSFFLTKSIASEIDALDNKLLNLGVNNTLDDYRSALLSSPLLAENYMTAWSQSTVIIKNSLNSANDVDALLIAFEPVKFKILLSFLAALDLEFCSAAYGTKLKLRPLFLDLLPKLNAQINEGDVTVNLPKWNTARLPIRRLLELTHAIYYFSKNKKWPLAAVGRKEFGEKTGYLDSEIGKFYNGSRELTLDIFTEICEKLDVNVGVNVKSRPPISLLIAAQCWQNSLVDKDRAKIKSLIMFDQADYLKCWSAYRAERANQVTSCNSDWPSWLND